VEFNVRVQVRAAPAPVEPGTESSDDQLPSPACCSIRLLVPDRKVSNQASCDAVKSRGVHPICWAAVAGDFIFCRFAVPQATVPDGALAAIRASVGSCGKITSVFAIAHRFIQFFRQWASCGEFSQPVHHFLEGLRKDSFMR
jgi:hypothetical protein